MLSPTTLAVRVSHSPRLHAADFRPGELVGWTLCKVDGSQRSVAVPLVELPLELVDCRRCIRALEDREEVR